MAGPNGSAYDAWGRMTSKSRGLHSATYGYRYGSKLYSVSSNFLDEGSVTYNYGGDQKRRQRTVGGVSTWYIHRRILRDVLDIGTRLRLECVVLPEGT